MIKKLTFIIILILSFGIISCFMQNSFKLKIDSYEYVITANNINDTFKAIIDNNTYDMTPLIYASFSGNLPLARFSIKSKADINAKDENGSTALIVATTNGNLEIIKYLSKERGLDINAIDDRGWTALIYAAESGNLEIVKYLIDERRADFNIKDNQGHDAFILAILEGHLEVVKYFVEEKWLDINAKDNEGWTAFMHAPSEGHLEVTQYLLDKGADIDAKDNYGVTSLMHASKNGHSEVVKYLVEFESRIDSLYISILAYLLNDSENSMDLLINNKANVNIKDNEGKTALMYACYDYSNWGRLNPDIIKSLIRAGANINEIDKDGDSALLYAIYTYKGTAYLNFASDEEELNENTLSTFETIRFLIYNGANINIRNKKGETPLSLSKGYPKLTQLLKDNGAY